MGVSTLHDQHRGSAPVPPHTPSAFPHPQSQAASDLSKTTKEKPGQSPSVVVGGQTGTVVWVWPAATPGSQRSGNGKQQKRNFRAPDVITSSGSTRKNPAKEPKLILNLFLHRQLSKFLKCQFLATSLALLIRFNYKTSHFLI